MVEPENPEIVSCLEKEHEGKLALELYKMAKSEITTLIQHLDEANKQYIQITFTIIGASFAGTVLSGDRITVLCCLTPFVSVIFAQKKKAISVILAQNNRYIRNDILPLLRTAYPKLRLGESGFPFWEDFTAFEDAGGVMDNLSGKMSSLLTIHLPSLFSLCAAGFDQLLRYGNPRTYIRELPHLHASQLLYITSVIAWLFSIWITLKRDATIRKQTSSHVAAVDHAMRSGRILSGTKVRELG